MLSRLSVLTRRLSAGRVRQSATLRVWRTGRLELSPVCRTRRVPGGELAGLAVSIDYKERHSLNSPPVLTRHLHHFESATGEFRSGPIRRPKRAVAEGR
jgi:hypothetical protein